MTSLLEIIGSLRDLFDKYAGKDGNKSTMTKAELTELLRKEFPGAKTDNAAVTKFLNGLDNDGDGVVNFQEFACFTATLSVIMTEEK